jgi:hydrogenase expression/formation protein HypC
MCLAVPGKIVSVGRASPGQPAGAVAMVDFQGSRLEASLMMTPEAGVGDWVLVHAGFAISVLDEPQALETWDYLQQAIGEEGLAEMGVRAPGADRGAG